MTHRPHRLCASALLLSLGLGCNAQTVTGPFLFTRGNYALLMVEPTIRLNPFNANDGVAAWKQEGALPGQQAPIRYCPTLDGWANIATSAPPAFNLPLLNSAGGCANCFASGHAGDPALAVSRLTGDISLVQLVAAGPVPYDSPGAAFSVAHKGANQADFDRNTGGEVIVRQAAPCDVVNDRPTPVIGPTPPIPPPNPYTNPECEYLVYDVGNLMLSARSKDVPAAGTDWELCRPNPPANSGYPSEISSDTNCAQRAGLGASPVVLPTAAGAAKGRLILFSRTSASSVDTAEVTWSDTGGGPADPACGPSSTWKPAQILDSYGSPNATIIGIRDNIVTPPPVPYDVQQWYHSDVSAANDPRPGYAREVYALFNGRDPAEPSILRFFVAWTDSATDADGPKFQSAQSGHGYSSHSKTYGIGQYALAKPEEWNAATRLHPFLGKLVIDDLGGIIVWCICARERLTGPQPPFTPCSARLARWDSRAALDAGQPPSFLWVCEEFAPWGGSGGYDYIDFAVAGCRGVGIWSDDLDGIWRVKLIKVVLPCPADVDANGAIDAADAMAFGSAYIAAQPAADVNRDAAIDARDVTDFVTAFTCGACPIPPH